MKLFLKKLAVFLRSFWRWYVLFKKPRNYNWTFPAAGALVFVEFVIVTKVWTVEQLGGWSSLVVLLALTFFMIHVILSAVYHWIYMFEWQT